MSDSGGPWRHDLAELCRTHGIDVGHASARHDLDALLDDLGATDDERLRLMRFARDAGQREGRDDAMSELNRLESELARLETSLDRSLARACELERELAQTASPAHPDFDAEEQFTELARLAHKINNPLTALLGRSQILKFKKGDDPEIGKAVTVIDESARRIAAHVKQLSGIVRAGKEATLSRLLADD